MKVVVQLQRTKAHLPELSITGVAGECCPDRQGPVLHVVSCITADGLQRLFLPSRGQLTSRHLMLAVDVRVSAATQTHPDFNA